MEKEKERHLLTEKQRVKDWEILRER